MHTTYEYVGAIISDTDDQFIIHLVRFQYNSSRSTNDPLSFITRRKRTNTRTGHIMSQSESPVNLLQDCVVGAGSASDATDIKCHQKYEKGDGSPMNIIIDVLSNKAASIKSFVSSDGSSAKSAHSTLIHDFNMSTRVWGDSSQR